MPLPEEQIPRELITTFVNLKLPRGTKEMKLTTPQTDRQRIICGPLVHCITTLIFVLTLIKKAKQPRH
jgi:hypothetical protein